MLAVDLTVSWGSATLHVERLRPGESFVLGEGGFAVPENLLGIERAPLVVATSGGAILVLLPRSRITVRCLGEGPADLETLITTARASPLSAVAGAYQLRLSMGATAEIVFSPTAGSSVYRVHDSNPAALIVRIAIVTHAPPPTRRLRLHGPAVLATACSFLIHAAWLGVGAACEPQSPEEAVTDGPLLARILSAHDEQTDTDPYNALEDAWRRSALGDADTRPMIDPTALCAQAAVPTPGLELGSSRAPIRYVLDDIDVATGPCNMWGDAIGPESAARDCDLGLTGIGEVDRSQGSGMALLDGRCPGDMRHTWRRGCGIAPPGPLGSYRGKRPQTRLLTTLVPPSDGRGPEVTERVVRQSFGRFRSCYQRELRDNPELEGRMTVRFSIGRDGAVSNVIDGGSDLPDAMVASCVVRAFYSMSFPRPESGIVRVCSSLEFFHGDSSEPSTDPAGWQG